MDTARTPKAPREVLTEAIEHAAHLLPAQGPIGVFVHHNTLHAFEHVAFEQAVVEAAEIFGAQPFMSSEWFAERMAEGRITPEDLDAVLADTTDAEKPLFGGRTTRLALRRQLVSPGLLGGDAAAIAWQLDERGLACSFIDGVAAATRTAVVAESTRWLAQRLHAGDDARALFAGPFDSAEPAELVRRRLGAPPDARGLRHALDRSREACAIASLWSVTARRVAASRMAARRSPSAGASLRVRDRLLQATGRDADALVLPILVPALSAFLDQGVAYWPMSDREQGFYGAFRRLVLEGASVPVPLLADVRKILRHEAVESTDAHGSVLQSLTALGIPLAAMGEAVSDVLLALPGWAGIMRKLENEPELAPRSCPPCRLVDFLAVRLILDRAAAARIARKQLGFDGELSRLPERLGAPRDDGAHDDACETAFAVFQLAQVVGVSAPAMSSLSDAEIDLVLAELVAFDDVERRRILHLAYERRHRLDVLRPLARRRREIDPSRETSARPRVQVAFCIDEREESLRRHLEEQDPRIETFGAAGFFGLAIAYRGVDDGHHAPLCPVAQTPAHEIRETGVEETSLRRYARRRKLWSVLTHGTFHGSRSLVRGWLATFGLGLLSMVPLAVRVLLPGPVTRLTNRLRPLFFPPPQTRLAMRRQAEADASVALAPGFTESEMADRVAKLLEDMGLVRNWARLVAVIGHGSSSLNNPHESAHDCGACGGRHGAANARLFAAMAGDPHVRAILRERGCPIPEDTIFVGGYHNTCNDAVSFFDTDAIPESHRADFEHLQAMMERARMLDAHERCRRFESVPLDVSPEAALLHVEGRAENLAEPRPEYGHATNAVCIFGRRGLTHGLFLDRRAFLVSYDPTTDPEAEIIGRLLAAMGPVGAGISLEYYFSFVDNERYGCGTKLPHNVTGLIGVMNGHCSDLRTGLPWQMVEIHEPVRLLVIVEATAEMIGKLVERHPEVGALVTKGWIQLALVHPESGAITEYHRGDFLPVEPSTDPLPVAASSIDWYRGHRGHLPMALISSGRATRGRA